MSLGQDGTIAPDGFQAPEQRLPTVDDSVLQGRWEITFEGDSPPGAEGYVWQVTLSVDAAGRIQGDGLPHKRKKQIVHRKASVPEAAPLPEMPEEPPEPQLIQIATEDDEEMRHEHHEEEEEECCEEEDEDEDIPRARRKKKCYDEGSESCQPSGTPFPFFGSGSLMKQPTKKRGAPYHHVVTGLLRSPSRPMTARTPRARCGRSTGTR